MPKKKPEPERAVRPGPTDCYPSAPKTPIERRDFMRRRNAAIAHVDEAAYLAAITAQDERVRKHGDESKKP